MGIQIDRPSAVQSPSEKEGKEGVAVEYAREMSKKSGKVTPGIFAKMKFYYSDEEIVEITLVVGLITMLNLFNNALEVN